jgi:limonene 1,2-monooxygenase
MRSTKLQLGLFIPPYHAVNDSTTLAYERDLQFTQYAEELGVSEVWFGEHHSGGFENSPSPELMIAAASQRTSRIRLGTGVVSLPYHNPLMTANRLAQLDHLTRGRLMFGAGPGLLSSDAHMLGQDARESRDKLDQGLAVIRRLLKGEWVTEETSWYKLQNAHCQILPFGNSIETCVASAISPSGGTLAAKHEAGMLCLAASLFAGYNALSANWRIAQDAAISLGRTMSPAVLRCATDMHIAETRGEAWDAARKGYEVYREYVLNQSGHIPDSPGHLSLEQLVERQEAVIGTPDDAIAQIRRLESQIPDFGVLLLFDRNWANVENKKRSLEMIMRYVLPAINGDNVNRAKSYEWLYRDREQFMDVMMAGTKRAFDKHESEKTGR